LIKNLVFHKESGLQRMFFIQNLLSNHSGMQPTMLQINFLILTANSSMVKMIQEKRSREALWLTYFQPLGMTVTVGSKQLG